MKNSQQAQASFFEYSSELFLIIDWDGQIRDLNGNWEKIVEFQRKDILLKYIYEFVHESQHAAFRGYLARLKETNQPATWEIRFQKRNGVYIWLHWKFNFDEKNRTICVVARPSRRSDEEYEVLSIEKEVETRFRDVLDESHIGIALGDFNGKILDVNPFFCKLLGYTREQILGKILSEVSAPEDYAQEFKTLKALELGAIQSYTTERRYLRKDSSVVWCQVMLRIDEDPVTKQKHVLRLVEDVSEKVATSQRLDRLIDVFPGVFFQYVRRREGQSQFTFVSDGSMELFGLPAATVLDDANMLYGAIDTQDAAEFHRSIATSAQKMATWKWCGRVNVIGSRPKWVQCTANISRNEKGDTVWDGAFLDISAIKEQELIIQEQSRRINSSVTMAMLWELFTGLVTEISGPVSAILGKAQLMNQHVSAGTLTAQKTTEYAQAIEFFGRRISKTLRGFKFIGRDGAKDPIEKKSIRSLLDEALELCQTRIREQQIEIKIENFFECPVDCRPVQITHVLLNLLNNSFDAVEKLPSKWIRIECQDQGEDFILSITDSGTGIPTHIVDKIMFPFFSTKIGQQNSGLGLSSAKAIVESHHGRLLLDRASSFTKFNIWLPKNQKKAIKVA